MNIYDTLKKLSANLVDSIQHGDDLINMLTWAASGFDSELATTIQSACLLLSDTVMIDFAITDDSLTLSQHVIDAGQEVVTEVVLDAESDLTTMVFPFQQAGVKSFNDLMNKITSVQSANNVVTTMIDSVTDSVDGYAKPSSLLAVIDSITDMIGGSSAVAEIKGFVASAGEALYPEQVLTLIQTWYLAAGQNFGRETSEDEQELITTAPHVDEFSWTIAGQVFSTILQAAGFALSLVTKSLGVITAIAGTAMSTILSIALGNENYGVNNAANGYLDIPLVARKVTSTGSSQLKVRCSFCLDAYSWKNGGFSYQNVFLKPFTAPGPTGLAFRFEDHYTSSIPTYSGFSAVGSILRDRQGDRFGLDLIHFPSPNNLIFDKGTFSDLNTANIAVWNALASAVLGGSSGLSYFEPSELNGKVQVLEYHAILVPGTVPSTGLTYAEICSWIVSLGYVFAFAPTNAKLYTADLANLISAYRELTSQEPAALFGSSEWSTPTNVATSFTSQLYWYSVDGGTAPSGYENAGVTYVNQAFTIQYYYSFSFVYAPNAALSFVETCSLGYAGFDLIPSNRNQCISAVVRDARSLPRSFTYQLPTASLLGKYLTLGAIVFSAAIIAGAVAFTAVKISKKIRQWRAKKTLEIEALKDQAKQTRDPQDVDAYISAARNFNLANKFLPGSVSYNIVSGWAEQTDKAGVSAPLSKLSTEDGISKVLRLIDPSEC